MTKKESNNFWEEIKSFFKELHQIISGNRRFESVKRLNWEEVDVNLREVKKEDEELLLIHFNKQRIKSFKELINEYLTLDNHYRKGQGKRTDLTSVKSNISYMSQVNTPISFQMK